MNSFRAIVLHKTIKSFPLFPSTTKFFPPQLLISIRPSQQMKQESGRHVLQCNERERLKSCSNDLNI